MKNTLTDLNNHLFEQLERLNDDELDDAQLDKELRRAEGMMVSFKNGDKEDLDIDNLMLITNAENLELHRSQLRFTERERTH